MSRLFLTESDRAIANEWRNGKLRVLCDVDPRQYREPTGKVIMVPCADGHQIWDICQYQMRFTKEGCEPMVHPLSLNGGPLLLAPGSPLLSEDDADDRVLLKHIAQANPLKGTPTVLLYSHAPCGAARAHGLTIVDVVRMTFAAKDRLKSIFGENLQVIPKIHIDWAEVEPLETAKRSYFLHRKHFETWALSLQVL